jgi:hypothetical protein
MAKTMSEQLEPFRQDDATLNWMMNNNVPLTRDKYIFHAYAGQPPKNWGAGHEAELPEPLQDMSKIGQ